MKNVSKIFPYPDLTTSQKFLKIRREFLKAKKDMIPKLVKYEDTKEWARK